MEKLSPKRKCPLCKRTYKNKAKNIALQSLICIYSDNKDLLEKMEEQENEEKKNFQGKNSEIKEDYKKRLEDLEKRLKILRKQEIDLMSDLVDCNEKVKTQEETIDIFDKQLRSLRAKLRTMENEVKLAEE